MRRTLVLVVAFAACGPVEFDHGECEPIQTLCHDDGRLWICPDERIAAWWPYSANAGYWHRMECSGGCVEESDAYVCDLETVECRMWWHAEGEAPGWLMECR